MAVRRILISPHKTLSTPARVVEHPQSENIRTLIADMKETVIAAQGVGLAAPQVGESLQVIVIYHRGDPYALINPTIIQRSDSATTLKEGCLSLPDIFIPVRRPRNITVAAITEEGEQIKIQAKDMLSKILQHEIDHINGVLITNHARAAK